MVVCGGNMHGSHWKWEIESILQVDWAWLGIEGEYGEIAGTEEH